MKRALLRYRIMFLVLQQSNTKLIPLLWFCNVTTYNCFTATMEWSCRLCRIVFLNGSLAEAFLTFIIWINFWNSEFLVWLNGMLPEIKNLRICLLILFCIYSFWVFKKNFESGPLAVLLPCSISHRICLHFTSIYAFIIDIGGLFLTLTWGCWKICPWNL